MEEQFNFDSIHTVRRANPMRNRRPSFMLKRAERTTGPTFIFSQTLFDRLSLANHSLEIGYDAVTVFLILHPENGGQWAKASAKGEKGKAFKNVELARLLDERGLNTELLDLASVGVNPANGLEYFKVVAYNNEPEQQDGPDPEPLAEMVADEAPVESMETPNSDPEWSDDTANAEAMPIEENDEF